MNIRGNNRILKIIRVVVALAPKIEPGLGILVDEQRREGADVSDSIVFEELCASRRPTLRRQGMMSGPQPEQIHHHHFAVIVPAILQEPVSGVQPCGSTGVSSESQFQSTRLKISYARSRISECAKCWRHVRTPHSKIAVSTEETSESHILSPVLTLAQ